MHAGFAMNWWEALYDDLVADILMASRPTALITAITGFLRDQLRLQPGQTVFDQCCGIGTLSVALARQGFHIVGVDQSAAYIRRAQQAASGLPCTFTAHDATRFVPPTTVDAALNWGTSFGNHLDDDLNRQMLRSAYMALRPGGYFVLDYQHIPRVLRHFQHTLTYRHPTPHGEVLLLRESTVDFPAGALRQQWTFLYPDGTRQTRTTAIRLYLPHDLGRLLTDCGFGEVTYYGDAGGEPLVFDSPRCLVVARRPL